MKYIHYFNFNLGKNYVRRHFSIKFKLETLLILYFLPHFYTLVRIPYHHILSVIHNVSFHFQLLRLYSTGQKLSDNGAPWLSVVVLEKTTSFVLLVLFSLQHLFWKVTESLVLDRYVTERPFRHFLQVDKSGNFGNSRRGLFKSRLARRQTNEQPFFFRDA